MYASLSSSNDEARKMALFPKGEVPKTAALDGVRWPLLLIPADIGIEGVAIPFFRPYRPCVLAACECECCSGGGMLCDLVLSWLCSIDGLCGCPCAKLSVYCPLLVLLNPGRVCSAGTEELNLANCEDMVGDRFGGILAVLRVEAAETSPDTLCGACECGTSDGWDCCVAVLAVDGCALVDVGDTEPDPDEDAPGAATALA